MKYTMEERDGKWVLLRYGELAGSALPEPGSFDNAHFEFWQRIRNLEKMKEQLLAACKFMLAADQDVGIQEGKRQLEIAIALAEGKA